MGALSTTRGNAASSREFPMKKYLVAAVLIAAFAGPALADEIYVMLDMTTKKCVTMATKPSDMTKFKMLGKYPTPGEAETAMLTMTECK
jgi:flagellar biosynthesis protein FlhB